MKPLVSTAIPCPWGASKEPITLPFLSMWIMAGGRTQQSASGGFSSASSSISVRSFGRSRTQTLSSLSTAKPVTPPIFHLFGSGLGQSGSNLNVGAVCAFAPATRHARKAEIRTVRRFMGYLYGLFLACEPVIARHVLDQKIRHHALAVPDEFNRQPTETREVGFRACILAFQASSIEVAEEHAVGKSDLHDARLDSPDRLLLDIGARIFGQNFGSDLDLGFGFVGSFAD